MTYDDELLHLTRPDHVNRDKWEACWAHYRAALALYKKAVTAVSYQLAAGLRPSEDQRRAEDAADDVLERARTALLDLAGDPPP